MRAEAALKNGNSTLAGIHFFAPANKHSDCVRQLDLTPPIGQCPLERLKKGRAKNVPGCYG